MWVGLEIVVRKLDRDLEAAKTYVEECGERWKNGVFYINPSCLSNKFFAHKPNPDFLYYLIPYDLSNGDLYISTPVPSDDRYWLIHAHNRNTDIDNDKFELLITRDKSKTADIPIALATSKKGVILNRLVMKYFSEY
ncbi:MAG: DUF1254 domain-containing protein [Candidatus Marinimicrobia bacterium]|nr:DUF1254 domain-containing protein [Candidatus Neomarinimicrobiota bacterium]MBT5177181.1 DUF1254 domain-containing protein [Candidatus Neomarinimicrobiota bacterium]MBT6130044.1 DUF1254 domain-containing protein [Candidatus Neomarinimicrobiota bacterium]MBT7737866.1 DUF1254 domain-containing protein [Candidatus Neomarinimicrobiota bacterium]